MTLHSNTQPVTHNDRRCAVCNEPIGRYGRGNACERHAGRIGPYPVGASCPVAVTPPRHQWPAVIAGRQAAA